MSECKCDLRTRLVGDGCERCNPQMAIDILREQIADMRLTAEERVAVDAAAHAVAQLYVGPEGVALAATLRGLLDRLE